MYYVGLMCSMSFQYVLCRSNVLYVPFSVFIFFFSLHFQIVPNAARMHYLASLFSKCSLKFLIVSDTVRMHHLASFSLSCPMLATIYCPCFHFFSAVPNRFKCSQNAPFTVLAFIFFLCSSK